jgi:hypothetical protein
LLLGPRLRGDGGCSLSKLGSFAPPLRNCGTSAATPLDIHTIVLLILSTLQAISSRLCDAQKSWRFCLKTAIKAASHNKEGRLRMKTVLAACLVIGPLVAFSGTAANAIDLAELAPCRPAAARLCDRSDGMTWTNLLRCGAVLAAHSWRVGNECRAVLRKYGQL